MHGATLEVARELGGYSVTYPNGAWVLARLIEDGVRLAAAQESTGQDALHEATAQALTAFLTAISSGTCKTSSFLGLRGVSLEGIASADVGVGILRKLAVEEIRAFAQPGPTSLLNHPDDLCLIIDGEALWTVSSATRTSVASPQPATMQNHELFPLVLLLAGACNKRGQPRVPQVVWNRNVPYFFEGGDLSGGSAPDSAEPRTSVFDTIVTSAVADKARSLVPALSLAPRAPLSVATSRLVSAALVFGHSRDDRLLDAAIAWEGLFGSQDRDQLSLQLALAIAWLRAPTDYAERERVYARAKKIYGLRSRIAHGGSAKAPDVEQAADELIGWLRDALVAMVTTHSPLLASTARTQRLLLQDPGMLATSGGPV
jgi:hypothetical protein